MKLFPSLWSGLNDYERSNLGAEMVPFLASGCHLPQRDQPFSATATFLEAAYHCEPPIAFDPLLIPVLFSYFLIRNICKKLWIPIKVTNFSEKGKYVVLGRFEFLLILIFR